MNILFIFTDQMHRYAMGCMGNPDVVTPNLDRFAREGVLFTSAYSNCPICTPFRINLFTGLYTSQTDTFGNCAGIPEGTMTLADTLNDGGYRTSYVGKWHIGASGNGPIAEELRGGFTDFIGYQCYNGFHRDVCFYDEDGLERRYERHRTDVTTDIAIERLERIADQPFALFVSYQAPHYPVQPGPEFEAMYRGRRIARRPNCVNVDPYTQTFSPPSPKPKENDPDYQKYGNDLDEYIRLYYGMVSRIDAGVGRLLDTLDRLGKRNDTVVVFTSDHGDMQGSHGLTNKCHPYEESSGIPLIVRMPGGVSGVVTDALLSGIDFYPTCLDWAGLPGDPSLPGRNFAPLIRGKNQHLSGPVFSEMRDWKMVREGKWKLVVEGEDFEPVMLFNLEKDPYEMTNLVGCDRFSSQQDYLLRLIAAWSR